MKLFMRSKEDREFTRKPHNIDRVHRMDTPSLNNCMDTTVMTMGSAFDKWRYQNGEATEVTQHIDVISAIWDEIQSRKS